MFRHQNEAAKGVWGSDAQYRNGHHQTTVVPQLRTQDLPAVSLYVCVSFECVGICLIKWLRLLSDPRCPPAVSLPF